MTDMLIMLVFLAFTAMCVGYVRWCDRMIGPDPEPTMVDAERTTIGALR